MAVTRLSVGQHSLSQQMPDQLAHRELKSLHGFAMFRHLRQMKPKIVSTLYQGDFSVFCTLKL
jgi:hypothetical protein